MCPTLVTVEAMTTRSRSLTLTLATGLIALATAGGSITAAGATAASDQRAATGRSHSGQRPVATCPPDGRALGFSAALDKKTALGAEVGGLSALTYDKRRHAYAAIEDHSGSDPTRMWFFRDPKNPTVTGTLLLTQADGTPYTGDDFDAEGLAILPNGDYLVSSEVEPSIHVFSRSGRENSQLPVPPRFAVTPAGEATANATLEGLSLSPDGSRIYAAMEETLSGDVSSTGDATYRRILVFSRTHAGAYKLTKQIGYRVGDGMPSPRSPPTDPTGCSSSRPRSTRPSATPSGWSLSRRLVRHPTSAVSPTLVTGRRRWRSRRWCRT